MASRPLRGSRLFAAGMVESASSDQQRMLDAYGALVPGL